MVSSASGWNHGKQIWRVLHDCEKGRYHLEIIGAAPAVFADVQKRLTEEQAAAGGEKADVDCIYDMPAELARTLTGFRHDQDVPEMAGDVYHVLEQVGVVGGKKSLAARLASMLKGNK